MADGLFEINGLELTVSSRPILRGARTDLMPPEDEPVEEL